MHHFKVGTHYGTSPCNKSQGLVASCVPTLIFSLIKILAFTFTVVHDHQYEPRYQSLRQELPSENQACLEQASIERSDDEWSDLSFYDLPDTLKVSEI